MKQIKNAHYEGERPLFASHGCSDIEAVNCRFEGKYPFGYNES